MKEFSLWNFLPLIGVVIFVSLTLQAAQSETPTIDEFAHVPAGYTYLRYGSFDLYAKNPPLMKLLMAFPFFMEDGIFIAPTNTEKNDWSPWIYGFQFMKDNQQKYFKLFFLARLIPIIMGTLTGLILYHWIRDLFGVQSAAITCTLYFLSPSILAHSHLATIDSGCMFAMILSLYTFRWAYQNPSYFRIAGAGAIWGVALLIKFTAILFFPAYFVLVFVFRWRQKLKIFPEFLTLVFFAVLILNTGMGFKGTMEPLGNFNFQSSFGKSVQSLLPPSLVIPLPKSYLIGFDEQKHDTEQGEFDSNNYLLGEFSQKGWWYYNFVAFAAKTPLPFLAMLIVCPYFIRNSNLARQELATILIPLTTLIFFVNFFNHLNIGIRYLLPIFPLLFLLTASIWQKFNNRTSQFATGIILFYYLYTAVSIHPNYLSYFNQGFGGPAQGHQVLLDSNLDWGQDLYQIKPALNRLQHTGKIGLLYFGHVDPAMYGIEYELVPPWPIPGLLAVSINFLMGMNYIVTAPDGKIFQVASNHLAWLRSHQPVMRLGSIWIFDTRETILSNENQ
ncbi:MAG: glycosyltransferase family 39 protein [SAR324 cluster bacterium]|nr:glycosyltransferase family 39 protein [SAR324 cluster bacterium]